MSVVRLDGSTGDIEEAMNRAAHLLHQWEADSDAGAPAPLPPDQREDLRQRAYELSLQWNVDGDAIIHSTRPGLGPWVIRFQTIVRELTWWFLEPILQQIRLFQKNTSAILDRIVRHPEQLVQSAGDVGGTADLRTLSRRVDALEGAVVTVLRQGLPVPPPDLIEQVSGIPEVEWFLVGGALAAQSVADVLEKNGQAIEAFESILDFGCGCGRVIRHWRSLRTVSVSGSDCSAELIDWCRRNLDFADFAVNSLSPPLEYGDSTFDFVIALSVFTHLPEPLQLPWMEELSRVLRPRGFLLVSTHGEHYVEDLSPAERDLFNQGQLVVRGEEHAGSNRCSTYHPESYMHDVLARRLEVVDFLPEGATGNPFQDLHLLMKPEGADDRARL
jgi:SAM-dependent methyltransferase